MSTLRQKLNVWRWEQNQLRSHPVVRVPSLVQMPSPAELHALTSESEVIFVLPLETDEAATKIFVEGFFNDEVCVWSNSEQGKRKWIRARRVIASLTVSEKADVFVEAAQMFRRVATERVERLASHLGVGTLNISNRDLDELVPESERWHGIYDNYWRYGFHGFECAFTHQNTGQYLDVVLGYGDEFGVLDPYFFTKFLETTAEFKALRRLLHDNYHDARKVMMILEKENRLIRVPGSPDFRCGPHKPGLAAPRDFL